MNRFTDGFARASTIVTHYFSHGLADGQGRYAVERFRTRSDDRIRRIETAPGNSRARCKAGPVTIRTAQTHVFCSFK